MNTQPEALRLADLLERHDRISDNKWYGNKNAAAELRRLHEVNQELVEAIDALIAYTEACEGMLNASPAGQVKSARAALAKAKGEE